MTLAEAIKVRSLQLSGGTTHPTRLEEAIQVIKRYGVPATRHRDPVDNLQVRLLKAALKESRK